MSKIDPLRTYIEEFTLVLEQSGLSRTAARVLAWLLVCKPAEQAMNDIMEALQISKSSVSAATQILIQFKLIERVSLPGERRDYYRMRPGLWSKLLADKVEGIRRLAEVTEKGLSFIDDTDTTQPQHLQEMHNYVRFMEKEMRQLLRHWEEQESQPPGDVD